ncbi:MULTISPECIES: cytochrome c biogenesis protein CcsA [Thermoactinomyces]|uniref:Cytochrome c biogenesis protein CcsA n=1 Tax=Thermoactinomyces daqus TaxID=1329516 RepID=A0A7W1X7B1_9BACL|nr:cytochrome c biogenesis protein CcsA [Thermoactinomyces daqus]MBA4541412.1 cytochrome c biogenesis protein CcsA [Thermoactinomyces daqus]MBH8596884.1 cytochrome c biogenesis protein CcsA [Thermoactinomyces sp. CICC 10523]MBH8603644.1 cytochrome c biogenesis protein CcsA [Thermoactinomyces sp. CICC 10522]MBH8606809.1 cytochrome c biogenesis protein CcsA [Thermoactinomyces sp. CICC 10521]
MFAERWFYDFMIYAYALSLLFALADFFHPTRKSGWISYLFLAGVWVMQTFVFVMGLGHYVALSIPLDALFIYSWILIGFTLLMHLIYRMNIFYFIANLIGFIVFAINLFIPRQGSEELTHLLLKELVLIHVAMAMMAYAAFSLASIGSGLYLVNNHLLKQKKWNLLLRQLPSLGWLEWFSIWLVVGGTGFFIAAMVLGVIYSYQAIGHMFWTDPKVWGSFLVTLLYGWILYRWGRKQMMGRRLAWWNTLAILAVLINYVTMRSSDSVHHWF